VRSFAAQQLAAFKCPEALLLVDALPKTATEKVAKNVLRDRLADPAEPVERMW
jgi:acyl-coenzyme A synthetase/AMP-(fatty) acid ligase